MVAGTGAKTKTVTAGATITAGMALYKDAADSNKYKGARADVGAGGTTTTAACDGIALCGGAADQPIVIAMPSSGGNINLGATLAVGVVYVVSSEGTVGAIAPITDLGAGDEVVIVGIATTTSNLKFHYFNENVEKP